MAESASASNDIEVIVERSANFMGSYMGIYEADTSDAIGLHYQYYSESNLLKAMTYYKWDEAYGPAYYYNDDSKLIHLTWHDAEGELVKMIRNGINGTERKQFL